MSTFNNFVQCRVTTPITAVANSIGLYAAVPPYSLPSEEGGLLVLTDSPTKPSKLEVISYTSRSALGLYGVTRGLEGTTAQAWTGPVYCYQSLLAGEFKTLLDSKVDSVAGKQLSDRNFTQVEKTKLNGVAVEATKNRADSENADKVHPHTMAQVTGLDTALAGKASTTDPRFTDAREWTAATISQAEAETGTATTRRAFTAQRVRQSGVATVKSMTVQSTGQSTTDLMSQKATTDSMYNIPSVPKSSAYTVTVANKGASIDTTANVTIPASIFSVGDVIVVTNTSASDISITPASGVTFRLAGTDSTGVRTLAGYGVATLRMVSSNVWFASGAGLS